MKALGSLWSAFTKASGRQKVVIVVAALVIVGAIGNTISPTASTRPGATVSPTSPAAFAQVPTAKPTEATEAAPTPTDTPEPTAAPMDTPEPTVAATPKPTPAPTPKPTSFFLTFTSLTSPVYPNNYATAKVKTIAGASCTIEVDYKSGPSTAAGLGPKTANSSGVASWTWKVGGRTTPGSWPVTVTCSKGGSSKSVLKYLNVL